MSREPIDRTRPEDIEAANAAAWFHPATGPQTHPTIEVAGVMIAVYVDRDAGLVISADFDTSELGRGHADVTPVTVRMSGETVWAAGHAATERRRTGMIGETLGVGISGRVIAALECSDDPARFVVVVDTGRDRARYVTARIWVDAAGRPRSQEWDAGMYHSSLATAYTIAGLRARAIAPADLDGLFIAVRDAVDREEVAADGSYASAICEAFRRLEAGWMGVPPRARADDDR